MKSLFKFKFLLVLFFVFTFNLYSQSNMKWTFLAIKSPEYKEYIIGKISANPQLKYIAYCPTHQGIFFKYNANFYNRADLIYTELTNNDEKLKESLLFKINVDNETEILDLIQHCDFDETNATAIKQELEKNQ